MPWVLLWVGVAVLGLVVLGAVSYRLWKQVRQFGRDVAAAGAKIAKVTDELAKVSPPPSR